MRKQEEGEGVEREREMGGDEIRKIKIIMIGWRQIRYYTRRKHERNDEEKKREE